MLREVAAPMAEQILRHLPDNVALPLEHKLMNGRACGNLDLADVVNNPVGSGEVWVSGYLLPPRSCWFAR